MIYRHGRFKRTKLIGHIVASLCPAGQVGRNICSDFLNLVRSFVGGRDHCGDAGVEAASLI